MKFLGKTELLGVSWRLKPQVPMGSVAVTMYRTANILLQMVIKAIFVSIFCFGTSRGRIYKQKYVCSFVRSAINILCTKETFLSMFCIPYLDFSPNLNSHPMDSGMVEKF